MLPAVILLSAGVGALTGMALILLGRQGREQPLPFGPFLAAAGWIALLWGEDINRLYLDFAGL
ncbi:MAG: prepilin peptidase, partial [Candidatus Competibacteraceae bacterium]|nr:prepilin peptidase [Candidatus Competibacteraceae bacterium]